MHKIISTQKCSVNHKKNWKYFISIHGDTIQSKPNLGYA